MHTLTASTAVLGLLGASLTPAVLATPLKPPASPEIPSAQARGPQKAQDAHWGDLLAIGRGKTTDQAGHGLTVAQQGTKLEIRKRIKDQYQRSEAEWRTYKAKGGRTVRIHWSKWKDIGDGVWVAPAQDGPYNRVYVNCGLLQYNMQRIAQYNSGWQYPAPGSVAALVIEDFCGSLK